MPIKKVLQGGTEVAQEMPAVGNLDGAGCPGANALGVGAGPITRDDLHAWVIPEPGRDGQGLAIGQQVDGPVALEVDDDGAVAPAAAPPGSPSGLPLGVGLAQSSMPMILGEGAGSLGVVRISRSRVSPLTGMARRVARRAPGSPPMPCAMARWISANLPVRRARTSMAGSRSAKIRRGHAGTLQRRRRTWTSRATTRPCQGRSAKRRVS
jgi:hypothetical protein